MINVEICMRLSKIGWMSQMVIDHKRTLRFNGEGFCSPHLSYACDRTRLSSLIMDKIHWSDTLRCPTWSSRYESEYRVGTTIGDIAL